MLGPQTLRTRKNLERQKKLQDEWQRKQARTEAEMKAGGFVDRSSSRFLSALEQTTTTYKGGVEQKTAPFAAPPQAPPATPTKPVEDFTAAKQAYHRYFTANNGYDKGQAFLDFGRAIGLLDKSASGITGGQKQADTIAAVLHDRELSAFKYDREGVIKHVQQIPTSD